MMPVVAQSFRIGAPAVRRGVAERWAPRAPAGETRPSVPDTPGRAVGAPTVPAAVPPAAIPTSTMQSGGGESWLCGARCNTTPTPRLSMVGPADDDAPPPTPPAVASTTTDDSKRNLYIILGVVALLLVLWFLSERNK